MSLLIDYVLMLFYFNTLSFKSFILIIFRVQMLYKIASVICTQPCLQLCSVSKITLSYLNTYDFIFRKNIYLINQLKNSFIKR